MKHLLLLILAALPLFSQSQTKVAPDCTQTAFFTGTGNSTAFDNRTINTVNSGPPCVYWSLEYSAPSTVTATTTLAIQGAPDNNGTPGSFTSLATLSTLQAARLDATGTNGYYPWMRISVTAFAGSGTIRATLNGWRANASTIASAGASGGCPGTSGSPCDVQGVTATGAAATENPVLVGGKDTAGNKIFQTYGTSSLPVTATSSGLTQIVALSGTTQIRITHFSASLSAASNLQLEYGTGSNCGTGTTALTGVYQSLLTIALDFDLDPLLVPAGQALCVNLGTSVTAGGLVKYAQF